MVLTLKQALCTLWTTPIACPWSIPLLKSCDYQSSHQSGELAPSTPQSANLTSLCIPTYECSNLWKKHGITGQDFPWAKKNYSMQQNPPLSICYFFLLKICIVLCYTYGLLAYRQIGRNHFKRVYNSDNSNYFLCFILPRITTITIKRVSLKAREKIV
jgi:hypothetical protein